jgi:flagellar biosynthesis protein FlhF
MKLETFTGSTVPDILGQVRDVFGADAAILSVKRLDGPVPGYEVVATSVVGPTATADGATASDAARPAALSRATAEGARPAGPRVIVLAGPTGAGKTTTLAKLAGHPAVFGGLKVGFISLDIFRVGAAEQLREHARFLRVPMAVAYEEDQALRALRRFRGLDVVLVDTPGRGPREQEDARSVHELVRLMNPNEVHLALPAGVSPGFAWRIVQEALPLGVTHLLPTKLDEFPDGETLRALAKHLGLSVRWMANGQRVPGDLRVVGDARGDGAARWWYDEADAWIGSEDLTLSGSQAGSC